MKKASLILLLMLSISYAAFSQVVVNGYRNIIRRELELYKRQAHYTTIFQQTDTSMSLLVRDSTVGKADFLYHFNKPGNIAKCDRQVVILYCDSCLRKFLKPILADDRYHWVKLNDTAYISAFNKKCLLAIVVEDPIYSYVITREHWDKEAYRKMVQP